MQSCFILKRLFHIGKSNLYVYRGPKGAKKRFHKTDQFTNEGIIKEIEPPPSTTEKFHLTDSRKWPYEVLNPYRTEEKQVYPEYEESREEWKYVLNLFPLLYVPEPRDEPSSTGWQPPSKNVPDLPYFVRRTRNHMLPVYLEERNSGSRKFTIVRQIQGDIWACEQDLKEYIQEKVKLRTIASRVNEPMCNILYKGNYLDEVKEWLHSKGF